MPDLAVIFLLAEIFCRPMRFIVYKFVFANSYPALNVFTVIRCDVGPRIALVFVTIKRHRVNNFKRGLIPLSLHQDTYSLLCSF